ncbi:MAG: hypothetical protein M2R45_00524 [Verrucomicrobia subdivision 3 bacterium]|nr:hypothetical protein [Limisphaerales bacterium]MCS1413598.1 hypothetical protein [Limisphaerales bacterium]
MIMSQSCVDELRRDSHFSVLGLRLGMNGNTLKCEAQYAQFGPSQTYGVLPSEDHKINGGAQWHRRSSIVNRIKTYWAR